MIEAIVILILTAIFSIAVVSFLVWRINELKTEKEELEAICKERGAEIAKGEKYEYMVYAFKQVLEKGTIAVVGSRRQFQDFVDHLSVRDGAMFTHISKPEDAHGRRFLKVIKISPGAEYHDLYKYVKTRLHVSNTDEK